MPFVRIIEKQFPQHHWPKWQWVVIGGNRSPTEHGFRLNDSLLYHWAKERIAEADEVFERCQLPRFLEWHLALHYEHLMYHLLLVARFGRDIDAVQFRLAFEPESVLGEGFP